MVTERPEREAANVRSRKPTRLPAVDSEGARRELVRRIVHSPTFARSERLGTLLTYICDLTLKGREDEINEQKIGHAVFGRSQDYDSAADGIVRSQASRLRQRLELYFQQEGADEPTRVVIPRGGYVPIFEARANDAPSPIKSEPVGAIVEAVPQAVPASAIEIHRISVYGRLLPWGLCVVLVAMLAGSWIHYRRNVVPASKPHPFWSHLFTKDRATLVVAPDSGLVLFRNMSGRDIDLKAYLDAGYRAELSGPPEVGPDASRSNWLTNLANRRYTSIVDLETILSLKDRAQSLGDHVSVRYARDLRPDDLKTRNLILLGSSAADPWVELFERSRNFVLKDGPGPSSLVINRNPRKGEPPVWEFGPNDAERRVFGLVAYVPSLTGDGNALILEGVTMSGTEAAMDFVSDDTQLMPFLDRIRYPNGTLPHFEVLLSTKNMGSSSIRSEILAWRTIK